MTDADGAAELRRRRAAAQLLGDSKRRTPSAIVKHLLAVQAQDFASVPLALRARSHGLKRSAVHGALDSGELILSWLNRGTLHLVHRDDYWWLHSLTAPTIRTANNRRLAEEGVTDVARKVRRLTKLLEGGPMLRSEVGDALGLKVGGLTHTLMGASLDGLIVRGPVRGKEQTFVLARDHLGDPPAIDRDRALAELVKRYRRGHTPATAEDVAYWSGLPIGQIRRVWSDRRVTGAPPGAVAPKLIPPFDPYIMGWKERSFVIPAAHSKQVIPGGGMFRAVVLVDGVAAGTWSRAGGRVTVTGFERDVDGLELEIADVERFLA